MNKTKIILSATGGVILVAVLVMAALTWMSYSAKVAAQEGDDETGVDGLETVMQRARSLSAKRPYPCAASVKQISSSRDEVVAWKNSALQLVASKDVSETATSAAVTTPVAFREFIGGDAKRIKSLPADGGSVVSADFDFGPFRKYILGDEMPADTELSALLRKWGDFAMIAEILSSNRIVRLTSIAFGDASPASEAKEDNSRKGSRGKNSKQTKKAVANSEQPSTGSGVCTYKVSFLAKPLAFVSSVNALSTSERFIVIDDFSFVRESDVIASALGGGEKKAAQQAQSGRRRRGRGDASANVEDKAEDVKGGIVTDPVLDPPLAVTMTVSVYDFKSLEAAKEVEK